MVAISVRELKTHLSEHLERVQAGQRIVITESGRPIAELSPPAAHAPTLDDRLAELERAGEITLPKGKPLKPIRAARLRGRPVSETLLEDRR